jgi:hypothetical protein
LPSRSGEGREILLGGEEGRAIPAWTEGGKKARARARRIKGRKS